jgi:DNA-binding protein H-NS
MKELINIRKQIEDLQEKEKELMLASKASAIEQIKTIMQESGVTLADLSIKKKKPAPSASVVLYRDGDNIWSGGRGRKPAWVTEHINKGVDIEEFKV